MLQNIANIVHIVCNQYSKSKFSVITAYINPNLSEGGVWGYSQLAVCPECQRTDKLSCLSKELI